MSNLIYKTEQQKSALLLIKENGYKTYDSRMARNGGFVYKMVDKKILFVNTRKIVPQFISQEYACQVNNREKLKKYYGKLKEYQESIENKSQQTLAQTYLSAIKGVQVICSNLLDDEKVNDFIKFLANKTMTDFEIDESVRSARFSPMPLYNFDIHHIKPLTKKDENYVIDNINYMLKMLRYIKNEYKNEM